MVDGTDTVAGGPEASVEGQSPATGKERALPDTQRTPSLQGEWVSQEHLTESILRRIMRVACAVGTLGLLNPLVSGHDYNAVALGISALATLVVFVLTFVSMRVRWLSYIYPWALVLVGIMVVHTMGLTHTSMLLVAGGLFIGSLVLSTPALLTVVLATAGLLTWTARYPPAFVNAWPAGAWSDIATTLLAVVAPAAVAGRMLVGALARSLATRQALVDELSQERASLKETVHTLESTRHQLTQAQKLELVSQMAGGIAHDMSNALTAVLGEASLLDDAVAEQRERILRAGDHAAKLTHQLMMFGRNDISQPRPLDLAATLRGFEQSIRRMLPSDIVLTTRLPEEQLVVRADPTQLLQVLLNLAGNARDAMQHGGTLQLSLELDSDAEEAVIRVADTGSGISQEALPRIFEPFFTTKPVGKGTGLGLANVRQLVSAMRGTVHVTSQPEQGACFVIRLPITAEAVARADVEERSGQPRTGAILVVDDDVRVRAMVYTALELQGHRVFEAADARAAAEISRSHRGAIDVLLTDVVIANGGGAEVIRQVRAHLPNVRVLVMSGYADDEALSRGIANGEYPFLAKPFTAEQLELAVDTLLAH